MKKLYKLGILLSADWLLATKKTILLLAKME